MRRTARMARSASPAMITVAIGSQRKEPVPRKISAGSAKVTIEPSVISCAMPRPATIKTSVAMIGWICKNATRKPFQRPQITPTPSAASTATGIGCPETTSVAATAPATAITAPTERSMPLVAITGVMPIARMATGAPRFSTSIRLPNSRPSCRLMSKKPGNNSQLSSRIAASARLCALISRRGENRLMPEPLRVGRRFHSRSPPA